MSDRPAGGDGQARPRVGVLGLWHLGSVTAACLAEGGFDVVGLDPDPEVVAALAAANTPVAEPGLAELIAAGMAAGNLRFATPDADSLAGLDILWVAFDTPVDAEDRVDTGFVVGHVREALPGLDLGTLVVTSSQLPVGTVGGFEAFAAEVGREDLEFAAVPENLRLGKALDSFRAAERFVAGVRGPAGREALAPLLEPFGENIEWMGVESAEMTKHALNGFLATSVAYINEIATISEAVGADAAEVSRGLKSDVRIGPRSYLSPGDAFAGGTLARDISSLRRIASSHQLPDNLVAGVAASNDAHRRWARRVLSDFLAAEGGVAGRRIAVWGLAYKPGTDTLRRSSSLELCHWLREQGAEVCAHDPAVVALPAHDAAAGIEFAESALAAASGADALVVSTAWPEYREIPAAEILGAMKGSLVVDAAGHLAGTLGADPAATYVRVGVEAAVTDGVLSGKAALISGANQGLGLEIARHYVDAGASVFVCARDPRLLAAAHEELVRRAGDADRVAAMTTDVADEAQVDALVATAIERFPELSILVNNAGVYGPKGPIETIDWEQWKVALEVNVYGSILPVRAIIPQLRRLGGGKIVQLSGGGATSPLPGLSSYAASKAAIVRFAETLSLELAEDRIDVNSIAPGALNTRLLDEVLEAGPEAVGEDFYRRSLEQQASGGTPLELGAELAVWLGSPASDGVTGRLLSARWDPWRELPEHFEDLSSDVYTLRRIVPADRDLGWGLD